MLKLSIIVAMTEQGVIGIDNRLPWHLPQDLAYFKRLTLGKPVLMGRKTYQSIGKSLPERRNIVITRQRNFHAAGCEIAHSLEEALALVKQESEVFVIGGAELFQAVIDRADSMYITWVHADIAGDTYFPHWNRQAWREISREDHPADARHRYAYSFVVFERKLR